MSAGEVVRTLPPESGAEGYAAMAAREPITVLAA
jgi:hypothetical protein